MKNTNTTGNRLDVIKANRKGSRDAGLENTSGWTAVRKVHNSKANYTRKNKHKKSGNSDFFYARTRRRRSSPAQYCSATLPNYLSLNSPGEVSGK